VIVLAGLLAALATVAAGCGGGGKSSATGTASSPTTTAAVATTPASTTSAPKTGATGQKTGTTGQSNAAATPHATAYEVKMQVLGDRLSRALAKTGRDIALPGSHTALIERDLRVAQRQIRAAAASLEQITPPARIKAEHENLIKAVNEFADELTGVIAGVEAKNGAPLTAVIPGLKGVKDMARASDAITKAGYAIIVQPK
jgi:hypothetical protein